MGSGMCTVYAPGTFVQDNEAKVVVLDPYGEALEHEVVYPHAPQGRRSEAKVALKDMVGRHRVGVVAIGNGTACRETEELIAEIIAEGTEFIRQGMVPAATELPPAAGQGLSESGSGDESEIATAN